MGWDWGAINQIADDVIITVGIAILIVRQFIWRSAEPNRMLRMPIVVIAAGIAYLIFELWGGFHWVAADWLVIAELGLVAVTGTVMGYVTHFRRAAGRLQYRLTGVGLILWAVFVAIRVGNFALANLLGANLAEATGLILLSFGVNRLAACAVVHRHSSPRTSQRSCPHASERAAHSRETSPTVSAYHRARVTFAALSNDSSTLPPPLHSGYADTEKTCR